MKTYNSHHMNVVHIGNLTVWSDFNLKLAPVRVRMYIRQSTLHQYRKRLPYTNSLTSGHQSWLHKTVQFLAVWRWGHAVSTRYYHRDVRAYLDNSFPDWWIGRRGSVDYPPGSPDLTPPDLFLWGYLKDAVCSTKPVTFQEFRQETGLMQQSQYQLRWPLVSQLLTAVVHVTQTWGRPFLYRVLKQAYVRFFVL
jgi:hypothetical protein